MVNPSSSAPKVFGLAVQFRLQGKFDVLVRTVYEQKNQHLTDFIAVLVSRVKSKTWSYDDRWLASYLTLFITKKKKVRSFGINPE